MSGRALVLSIGLSAALTGGARVDAVRRPPCAETRPGLVREVFRGTFDRCRLNLEYVLRDGVLVREKWGDYFCGLELGLTPKNGSWNKWDFLQVSVPSGKGPVNVLQLSRPVLFAGYSSGGADYLAADWRTADGALKLRFAAFPSYPDWLFLHVDFPELSVGEIALAAYPGSALVPEGRERHLATKERDWHLNVEPAEFVPVSPFVFLYSRYADERFGNKLVFDPASVGSVRAGRTTACVTVRFRPREGAKAADFALGFFSHRDAEDQRVRFLGEDGDSILSFLKGIDWGATPDPEDFAASVRIARSLGVDGNRLEDLVRRHRAASQEGDLVGVTRCFEDLWALRKEKTASGLDELAR